MLAHLRHIIGGASEAFDRTALVRQVGLFGWQRFQLLHLRAEVGEDRFRALGQLSGNLDNPLAHYEGTGPEIWRDTEGKVTHFVSSMGTTGTIMGTSRFLKEQNPNVRIIGVQPEEGAQIPGIRKWPQEYMPKIYDPKRVDELIYVGQKDAENITRKLATQEGIFAGISSGGALYAALELSKRVENAVIVTIVCDRGDRYLSTGVFPS